MTPDPGMIAGALGCFMGALTLLLVRRQRAETMRKVGSVEHELEAQKVHHASQIESLKQEIEVLSAGRKSSEDILREGRLSHSSRAQAFQMLRSGVTPERAAVSLRLPCREVRLLGKVSRLLSAYR